MNEELERRRDLEARALYVMYRRGELSERTIKVHTNRGSVLTITFWKYIGK